VTCLMMGLRKRLALARASTASEQRRAAWAGWYGIHSTALIISTMSERVAELMTDLSDAAAAAGKS